MGAQRTDRGVALCASGAAGRGTAATAHATAPCRSTATPVPVTGAIARDRGGEPAMSARLAAVAALAVALVLPPAAPPGAGGALAGEPQPQRLAQARPSEGHDDSIREPGGLPGKNMDAREPGS